MQFTENKKSISILVALIKTIRVTQVIKLKYAYEFHSFNELSASQPNSSYLQTVVLFCNSR